MTKSTKPTKKPTPTRGGKRPGAGRKRDPRLALLRQFVRCAMCGKTAVPGLMVCAADRRLVLATTDAAKAEYAATGKRPLCLFVEALSLEEIALASGVPRATCSRAIRGEPISTDNAKRLSARFPQVSRTLLETGIALPDQYRVPAKYRTGTA